MDSLFIVICALIANAVFAGPRALYERLGIVRLLQLPARKLREVERRLNREHRLESELEVRGYIVLAAGVCAAFAIGGLLSGLSLYTSKFLDIAVLAVLLPVRPAMDMARSVQKALQNKNNTQARTVFATSIWRHHAVMDEYALARAAMETLAVHFAERILAPIMFYVLFGLPGALACLFVTLLHDTVSGGSFSKAAKQVYVLTHWLPSRFAACLWIMASAFLPDGNIKETAKHIWPLMGQESAQILALSCAGHVLHVSLGGPASVYSGGKWLGGGTPKPLPSHVGSAVYLFAVLHVLLIMILGLML